MNPYDLDAFAACTRVSVIAGHYCVSPDLDDLSSDGAAELLSFRHGAEIHRQLLRRRVGSHLYLWVNDIGISPDDRAALKAGYQLPAGYADIAVGQGLDPAAIRVLFESSARNKASTWLRKRVRDDPGTFRQQASMDTDLVRCVDGVACDIASDKTAWVIDGPDGESLVVKDGPNPKCNLILATLFQMVLRQSGSQGIVNVFNDIYVNRLRLGEHVFRRLHDQAGGCVFHHYFCSDAGMRQVSFAGTGLPAPDSAGAPRP